MVVHHHAGCLGLFEQRVHRLYPMGLSKIQTTHQIGLAKGLGHGFGLLIEAQNGFAARQPFQKIGEGIGHHHLHLLA